MLPAVKPQLTENLKRLSEIIVSVDVNGRGETAHLREAFRNYALEKGFPTRLYTHSHWKHYGVSNRELMRKLITHYRDTVFPDYGLQLLVLGTMYVVHNTSEILAVGVKTGMMPNYVSLNWFGFEPLIVALRERLVEEEGSEPESYRRFYIDDRAMLQKRTVLPPPFVPLEHFNLAYPYLDQTPEQFWEAFKASPNNVTLLIGPPGTGKSSFLRCVLRARGTSEERLTFLADSASVIAHPRFMENVRDLPVGSLMVTEDSDAMLAKREDHNMEMSALLNATSGLASTDTKFVISTNLSGTQKVDSALLRRGRLYRTIHFRNLTVAEAYALREAMTLPFVDLSGFTKGVPLTDALNVTQEDCASRQESSFGFN
jgi:hypothetical protein